MLIVGAGACARDLLAMILQDNPEEELVFFDDVTTEVPALLYDKYPILRSVKEVIDHFKSNSTDYVLGIGNPIIRNKMSKKIDRLGGNLISLISEQTQIGTYNDISRRGVIIMHGSILIRSDVISIVKLDIIVKYLPSFIPL